MQYLCPKCGNFMESISLACIPSRSYYQCFNCGYTSKYIKDEPSYMTLPKELWSDEDEENEI